MNKYFIEIINKFGKQIHSNLNNELMYHGTTVVGKGGYFYFSFVKKSILLWYFFWTEKELADSGTFYA